MCICQEAWWALQGKSIYRVLTCLVLCIPQQSCWSASASPKWTAKSFSQMSACYTQLQASELVVPEFLALNTISSLFQPWQTELRCQQRISIIKELVFGLTTLVLVWKGAVAGRLHSVLQPESMDWASALTLPSTHSSQVHNSPLASVFGYCCLFWGSYSCFF